MSPVQKPHKVGQEEAHTLYKKHRNQTIIIRSFINHCPVINNLNPHPLCTWYPMATSKLLLPWLNWRTILNPSPLTPSPSMHIHKTHTNTDCVQLVDVHIRCTYFCDDMYVYIIYYDITIFWRNALISDTKIVIKIYPKILNISTIVKLHEMSQVLTQGRVSAAESKRYWLTC